MRDHTHWKPLGTERCPRTGTTGRPGADPSGDAGPAGAGDVHLIQVAGSSSSCFHFGIRPCFKNVWLAVTSAFQPGPPRDPAAIFLSGGRSGRRGPCPTAQALARRAAGRRGRLPAREGRSSMTSVLVRKVLVSALSPLLRLSPHLAMPRALSTLLPGPFRAAGATGTKSTVWGLMGPLPLPGPLLPGLQPALGFKTKGVIKKRCRDCYRVKRRGRWYIYCKTNPKHKQRQM